MYFLIAVYILLNAVLFLILWHIVINDQDFFISMFTLMNTFKYA